MRGLIEAKFAQFAEHRALLTALLKAGVDPRDPLSPFGAETKEVRDDSIAWYARALEAPTSSVPKDLAAASAAAALDVPHGPDLLLDHRRVARQRRTQRLVDATLDLVVQLLKVSSLPLMGPLRKRALKVLRAVDEE